jgi:hypothetical protein
MDVEIPSQRSGKMENFSYDEIARLPKGALIARVLNVDYVHLRTSDGGDIYLTQYGLKHLESLMPQNWHETEWFEQQRVKLVGTSMVYRLPTRPVDGKSIDLVVKYCRVGQDVPLETSIIYKALNSDFNSPFEEFALLKELRDANSRDNEVFLRLQVPLAIYAPPERMQLWQTGRSEAKIASKIAQHPGIEIDILRDYILVYGWIKGCDAVEANAKGWLNETELAQLTQRANDEMRHKGFFVLDMKPQHIIVTPDQNNRLVQDGSGRIQYSLIDFELLQRTSDYDAEVKHARRKNYLIRQRDRFASKQVQMPKHLQTVSILGYEYVYGHAESTGGRLWVVGKDPELFDYFLPERWRKTLHYKLSPDTQVFYTRTKDNVYLVWKVSRVGGQPSYKVDAETQRRLSSHGFNSPFEEFALALRLRERNVPAIYPRAIYMTGHRLGPAAPIVDYSRFNKHAAILTPDGEPILQAGYDYITIWGYWNGPDEMLADHDGEYYTSINAGQACEQGWLPHSILAQLIEREKQRLASADIEAFNLQSDHLLLSLDPKGILRMSADGLPGARLCNFQFLKLAEHCDGK